MLTGKSGRITLSDFKTGAFQFGGVDLLTLSACDTAVDTTDADGREIEGLGSLAQNQGAKGVIATLWAVADGPTGEFMHGFYSDRQQFHMNKAEALRAIQMDFIHGNINVTGLPMFEGSRQLPKLTSRGISISPGPSDSANERYSPDSTASFAHPYYWAPFILMGNWL